MCGHITLATAFCFFVRFFGGHRSSADFWLHVLVERSRKCAKIYVACDFGDDLFATCWPCSVRCSWPMRAPPASGSQSESETDLEPKPKSKSKSEPNPEGEKRSVQRPLPNFN